MNYQIARKSLILGAVCLFLPVITFQGCQTVDEHTLLDSIQKAIEKVAMQRMEAIVVVDVKTKIIENHDDDCEHYQHRIGSGFMYDASGMIVTADVILSDVDEITVITQDGKKLPAELVGRDCETNIAVIKVDNMGAEPIPLLPEGEPVGCLGLVLGNTYYSQGLACTWGTINQTWIGGGDFLDDKLLAMHLYWPEIQSGTPIIDVFGNVIGIAEGHLEKMEATLTIIPATTIKRVTERLIRDGHINRGWAGIKSDPVCPERTIAALIYEWKGKGAVISDVVPGSPAEVAGLQPSDIIVTFDSNPVICISDFRRKTTATAPGMSVILGVIRDGQEIDLTIELAALPDNPDRKRRCVKRSA
ncbi:hypothetical protein CEE37_06190 [candidate division LCP-89 bacterium B3_LCP]|uniref:PDZ domain-containing protein n=1 Tax=candidate division LCP-89 bacterium B3_LCP TaxID=2012998 RepID=A0A532V242_UNCL8|nr:MAG: hypothetical protein CEE37_06190 [candidate division LCP-89 bacterium B3_LCP]